MIGFNHVPQKFGFLFFSKIFFRVDDTYACKIDWKSVGVPGPPIPAVPPDPFWSCPPVPPLGFPLPPSPPNPPDNKLPNLHHGRNLSQAGG